MWQGESLSWMVGLAPAHGVITFMGCLLCGLSLPISCPLCRVRVSQDGQFLHYVFPYQFLDSPEWESLRPSEEGTFQVSP